MDGFTTQLKQLLKNKEAVKFINVYHGVPVSYIGNIEDIQNDLVSFRVHPTQILCIKVQGYTFLQNDHLPQTLKGTLISSDLKENIVMLSHFVTASNSIGQREYIRVIPTNPIDVSVITEQMIAARIHSFRAGLVEVSLHGIGIYLNSDLFELGYTGRGKQIDLRFNLPEEDGQQRPVILKGIVRNAERVFARRSVRMGLQTFPDKFTEAFLCRYIASRQNDVLKEIRLANDFEQLFYT